MFDNLSFGECIGTIMGFGALLRLGSLIVDDFLGNVRSLFHLLKVRFQVQKKKDC